DPRYPDIASPDDTEMAFTLAHPLLQPDGELTGVLELYRRIGSPMFYEEDEEIVNSYLVWGGIALHYAEMYSIMARQRKLHSFLLAVVRSIFQDMISMDSVIVKIMSEQQSPVHSHILSALALFFFDMPEKVSPNAQLGKNMIKPLTFAQKLVSADRASLFLVDSRTKELYARIFDVSGDNDEVQEVAKEISIIGVMQMVNKTSGTFNKADEEAFATFATYCGLALHHAKLYDKIRRSEQKYKVALEVLSYHATCTEEEVQRIEASTALPHPAQQLQTFSYSPYSIGGDEQVVATIFMFKDLFKKELFDEDSLVRFTLTVRKNYRRVPYHNWSHGFCVANAAYAILKHSTGAFKPLEELALFVSCLCHDLDHRGKTNQFLINSASPLASMYSTSTLEHHHFNQTVQILQQSGHNILKNLSSEDYKQVLSYIKHCILATDLALYFPNKSKLKHHVDEGTFDPGKPEHRSLLQAITMTACDLCASTKPWEQQRKTVQVIFEEFYEQGDLEKAEGRQPIPMMDRTKAHELPASQNPQMPARVLLVFTSHPVMEYSGTPRSNTEALEKEVRLSPVSNQGEDERCFNVQLAVTLSASVPDVKTGNG
ncbi:hypothetical protein HPB47_026893, partial [Ixodes persulcatus]